MELLGTVFNIQHYSLHDGPGIRTVVFLKGCPLRCRWCSNPESQRREPELMWRKSECIGCECCVRELKTGHFRFEGERGLCWDMDAVPEEGLIAAVCPSKALQMVGEKKSVDEVLDEVAKDALFYDHSEGGMTLSGGEPLSQPEFVTALLKEAKRRRIHLAMETSGYAPWDVFCKAAGYLDYLLMDIKCMDDAVHREYTGVSNKPILENFKRLRMEYPNLPIHVRTPVIPGVNDTKEEIRAVRDFLEPFSNVRYELLRYHRLGEPKYASLHREYSLGKRELTEECMERLREFEIGNIEGERRCQ